MPVNNLGRHIVVELYDCEPELLNNVEHIEKAMVDAARDANATVINTSFHHFSPFGVSGVVVIQESHLAIHTWPEYGYAAVDVFTCGETVNPWTCYKALMAALKADHGSAVEMGRGQRELLERRSIKAKGFEQPTQKAGVVDATMGETTGKVTGPSVERNIWFTERDEEIALSMRHRGDVLFRDQSPFQKVEVYDTYAYGKMLTLDGLVMTTEKDEYVYHEMITHPALFTHPGVKRALIIGGGDGGAVRELVRHSGIEKVVMVEIDGMVIEASKKHLPGIASAFDHPKLELRVDDGIKYVTECESDAFDLVIIDSTDPVGPAKGLFTHDFYRHVHRLLRKEGVMLAQSQSPRYNVGVFQEIFQCYRDIFGKDQVHTYLIQVPTYPSGTWAMAYASKGTVHPIQSFRSKEAEEFALRHKLKYYNEAIHTGSFALPGFVRELLAR